MNPSAPVTSTFLNVDGIKQVSHSFFNFNSKLFLTQVDEQGKWCEHHPEMHRGQMAGVTTHP